MAPHETLGNASVMNLLDRVLANLGADQGFSHGWHL